MTPHSKPSSAGSPPCRIDWRPSRWLLVALLMLAVLAPLAVLASELARPAAWLLAAAALVHGLHLAWSEWRRPATSVLFTADGRVLVGDADAADVRFQWRGPLAFMSWRDPAGRRMRLAWWPDTLPSRWRRELRLAADRACTARRQPSVAP